MGVTSLWQACKGQALMRTPSGEPSSNSLSRGCVIHIEPKRLSIVQDHQRLALPLLEGEDSLKNDECENG